MSKTVCLIFLLVTLLAVISTPTAAAGLEKKWDNNNCCPIAQCVFKKKHKKRWSNDDDDDNKKIKHKFDGFIQFVDTFNDQLYVSGFLDYEKPKKKVAADDLDPEFDVHVTDCNDFSFENIEGGLDLDNIKKIFDLPFATVINDGKKVKDLVGKCCIVAKDKDDFKHKVVGVAKVKQTVTCEPNPQIDL
ncbi:4836_t:CDS:1 [Paraglomus occultum]|uniref:4836_t:CDS:1 n=1 Tax=Paraglomus occultum TaxID=144539 RepID=A0A9N9B737_9GLOM|nr:4836_t:CDS:1 [Paraglomus occultum]